MSDEKKTTLKNWIEETADGEKIISAVIGEMGGGDYGAKDIDGYYRSPKNKVLSWEDAIPHLEYEFDSGYGEPGCQAIYVWTETKVMFVSQYDGSTAIEWVPRNPIDTKPSMPGG